MRALIIISLCGMELSWIYAWSNYIFRALAGRFALFFPMALCFFTGALLTGLVRGRGLRIIYILLIQALGFFAALFQMFAWSHAPAFPAFGFDWFLSLIRSPHEDIFWVCLVLEAVLALFCWWCGVALATRKKDYEGVVRRFDIGLSLIFSLFIIKFLARVRFDSEIQDPLAVFFIISFFFCALPALALSRAGGMKGDSTGTALKGTGFSFLLALLVMVICSAVAGFFLQPICSAAGEGYRVLSFAARPLIPLIVGFLKFIFGPRKVDEAYRSAEGPSGGPGGEQVTGVQEPGFLDMAAHFAAWSGLLLLALAGLVILCVLIYRFWLFLISRSAQKERDEGLLSHLIMGLSGLKQLFSAVMTKIIAVLSGPRDCLGIYLGLIGWAKICRVQGPSGETPREFGERLSGLFPGLRPEIMEIIHALEIDVYAEERAGSKHFKKASGCLHRLRSPRLWRIRLRACLSGSA